MRLRTIASILVGAAALVGMGSAAHADSIQVFGNPVLTPNGVNTDFAYTVVLTQGNQLQSGDFFSLVDFAGYVGVASINPSAGGAWALYSAQNDALTPTGAAIGVTATSATILTPAVGLTINDSNTIPDLVFQYTGPTLFATGPGNLTLGTFTITSTLPALGPTSRIVGADHQSATLTGANADPYVTPGPASAVPLPAAVWGGMGLMGALGGLKVARRRR